MKIPESLELLTLSQRSPAGNVPSSKRPRASTLAE
jgi:hypothetical protein